MEYRKNINSKNKFSAVFILSIVLTGFLCRVGFADQAEVLYEKAMRTGYCQGDYTKALIGLGEVCQKFPDTLSAERACYVITCILKYKLSLRESLLLKESAKTIKGIDVRFLDAFLNLRLGRQEQALEKFQQIFPELMTNPWAREAKDIFESVDWQNDILKKYPVQFAHMYLSLFEYACTKEKKKVNDYFQKIISIRPDNDIKKIKITVYEKIIEMFPEKERDYIIPLARLCKESDAIEKAVTFSKRAIILSKNAATAQSAMRILYPIYKKDKKTFEEIAKIKNKLNETESALLPLEKDKEDLLNQIFIACIQLGYLQEKIGDYIQAIKAYERALGLHPKDINICWALNSLYRGSRLYDKRIKMYEYMWDNFREKMGGYTKGQYAYYLAHDAQDYTKALRIAMGLSQKDQKRWLRQVYEIWGELELATERFFEDRENRRQALIVHRELSKLFLEEKMFGELLVEYKKLFVLDPDKENFTQLIGLLLQVNLEREVNKWVGYAREFAPELSAVGLSKKNFKGMEKPLSFSSTPGRVINKFCVHSSWLYDMGVLTDRMCEICSMFDPPSPEPGEKNGEKFNWELKVEGVQADMDVVIFKLRKYKRRISQFSSGMSWAGHCYYIVDNLSGNILWNSQTENAYSHFYVLEKGDLYSYNYEQLRLHEKKTGVIKWQIKLKGPGKPYIYSDYIYIVAHGQNGKELLKINRKTGDILKKYRPECLLNSKGDYRDLYLEKMWDADRAVFVSDKGDLITYDIELNKELYRIMTAKGRFYQGGSIRFRYRSNVAIGDEKSFAVSPEGDVFCFDTLTGEVKWERKLEEGNKKISSDDRYLYVGGENMWLTALCPETGEYVWSFPIHIEVPVMAKDGLIVCSGTDRLRSAISLMLNRDVLDSNGNSRPQTLLALAKELTKKGRNDLAIEILYQIIDVIEPGFTDAYVELAALYNKIGKLDKAAKMTGLALTTLVPGQSIDSILEKQKKELLHIYWQTRTMLADAMKPVSDGENLYVAYNSGDKGARIYGVSLADGKILWRQSIKKIVGGALTLSDGKLFIGEDREPIFYALDSNSGAILWTFSAPEDFECPSYPVVANGHVYFTARAYEKEKFQAILYALDIRTGKVSWQFSPQTKTVDTEWSIIRDYKVAIWKDMIFWGWNDGFVYALDSKDGNLRWQYNTCLKDRDGIEKKKTWGGAAACPVVFEDKIFFASRNSHLGLLDAVSGKLIWQQPLRAINGTLFTAEGKLFALCYYRSYKGYYYCLDPGTGAQLWKSKNYFNYTGHHKYQTWHINNGNLYRPGSDGYRVIELATGVYRYVQLKNLPIYSSQQIWVDNEKIYVIGHNFITTYKKEDMLKKKEGRDMARKRRRSPRKRFGFK